MATEPRDPFQPYRPPRGGCGPGIGFAIPFAARDVPRMDARTQRAARINDGGSGCKIAPRLGVTSVAYWWRLGVTSVAPHRNYPVKLWLRWPEFLRPPVFFWPPCPFGAAFPGSAFPGTAFPGAAAAGQFKWSSVSGSATSSPSIEPREGLVWAERAVFLPLRMAALKARTISNEGPQGESPGAGAVPAA